MADDIQWRNGVFFDAIKALGTGNSAGLFGAAVALHYFSTRDPQVIWHIKAAAAWYLIGIALFAIAYLALFFALTLVHPEPEKSDTPTPSKTHDTHTILMGSALLCAFASLIVWAVGTGIAARVIYLL